MYYCVVKICRRYHPEFCMLSRVLIRKASTKVKPSRLNPPSKVVRRTAPVVANTDDLKKSPEENHLEPEWRETQLDWSKIHHHYLKLSKIRLTGLVVVTTMAGYAIASAPFHFPAFFFCSLGTGLLSAAANAVNQYHEVPFDAQMSRTKNRVLVRAQITPLHALTFAVVTSACGLSMLYYGCNGLTAALGAANLILYTCVYTPLKRISILNTWVGSVVGALPPVMGWAACAGEIGAGGWLLAALLYAWQFPHFNALSWNLRPEYSRAGYRMMSVANPELCRKTALRYTVALTVLSCCAPLCNVTNNIFPIASLPLNIYFTHLAWNFYKEADSASSRKLFKFSLIQLPALIVLMIATKKYWFLKNQKSVDEAESEAAIVLTKYADTNNRSTVSDNRLVTNPILAPVACAQK